MNARLLLASVLCGGLLAVSCTGSSGGGAAGIAPGGFQLPEINLKNNDVWKINRPIEFTFSADVDFSTISSNTINIQSTTGVPATGTFFPKPGDAKVIVFQPTCPTKSDFSDAGFKPGGLTYVLTVIGLSSNAVNTVRATNGVMLSQTQTRRFTTPISINPNTVFLDTTLGPPVPVVRTTGSTDTDGVTYIEVGNNPDPASRIFYEFNPTSQIFSVFPAGAQAPLNLYSDTGSTTAVLIEFNQAVNPDETNISSDRLRLEFLQRKALPGDPDVWLKVDTRVELVANCTRTGATVRLEPIGLLPADSKFRVAVLPGFQDIVGQTTLLAIDGFGVAETQTLAFVNLNIPDDGADEFFEDFLIGGDALDSFQDTEALFDSPEAEWENGRLRAAFSFEGDGGPNGEFDWVVKDGQTIIFDTNASSIIGGPMGTPTDILNTSGGIVSIRDLHIEKGGEIRVQGPNPMQINASGEVRIEGRLVLSGFNAKNVATLNTGNQPEVGGAGAGGGGVGGRASEVITSSTPRGGSGGGPFGQTNVGGRGGETGFAADNLGKDARRPGGGGGGRFGRDQGTAKAEAGKDGENRSRGATTGVSPARGGRPGAGPFVDGDIENDFFGTKPIKDAGNNLIGLIRGELPSIWAGYGGGGGGDALPANRFPSPRWGPGSDEKGGGGGGGSGALRIRALGKIIFSASGRILALGGQGATGENTIFLDHVGGSGGSGSGGHIVLETAAQIDFTDEGNNVGAGAIFFTNARGGPQVVGAMGDQGGTVPLGISHGGPGGPGVVQIHVPDPLTPPSDDPALSDIIVPTAALSQTNPLSSTGSPTAETLIPTFGARSQTRSKWISIGGADEKKSGTVIGDPNEPIQWIFRGTNPADGKIERAEDSMMNPLPLVKQLGATLGPDLVPSANGDVSINADRLTLEISGAALDPLVNGSEFTDLVLRTPALLRNWIIRLEKQGAPAVFQEFNVESATVNSGGGVLSMTVDGTAGSLQDFVDLNVTEYQLIPQFFRVFTPADEPENRLPLNSFVRITFQATGADAFGNPDEMNIKQDWTGDISLFNNLNPGDLKFFRFEVEFDLDEPGAGVTVDTEPVELRFLRVPFRF